MPRSHVNGVPDVRFIIVIAFTLMVGLMFTGMACNLYRNWWPLSSVFFYVTAPLPNFFCSNYVRIMRSRRDALHIGAFLTGALIVCGLALPAVLAHAGVIRPEALLLCTIGGVIVYSSVLVYVHSFLTADTLTFIDD